MMLGNQVDGMQVNRRQAAWPAVQTWLVLLAAVLTLVAVGGGLLWPAGEAGPATYTSLHGKTVTLYGQGLYRYDTLMVGAGYGGSDWVTLGVGLPLLLWALVLARRGALHGQLLLVGALGYLMYYAASLALGAAYNPLFVVYLALFSAVLFALIQTGAGVDRAQLAAQAGPGLPWRALQIYLYAVGVVLFVVWFGMSLLPALLRGEPPPELAHYTTLVTHVLDLGVIMPVALWAAVLVGRRTPVGLVPAVAVLVLSWTIGVGVIAAAVAQVLAGAITPLELAIFVLPFAILSLTGMWLTRRVLGRLSAAA